MLRVNEHHPDPREVVVVVVPTKRPSLTAPKQPFGSSDNNLRQSASVWFQPAASFSPIAEGMSDSTNKRISSDRITQSIKVQNHSWTQSVQGAVATWSTGGSKIIENIASDH